MGFGSQLSRTRPVFVCLGEFSPIAKESDLPDIQPAALNTAQVAAPSRSGEVAAALSQACKYSDYAYV